MITEYKPSQIFDANWINANALGTDLPKPALKHEGEVRHSVRAGVVDSRLGQTAQR